MSMTLDDVTLEIMQSNEHLEKVVDLKTDENSLLESMAAALDIVVESFNEMLDKSESISPEPLLETTSESIGEAPMLAAPLASGPTEAENAQASDEEEAREDDKRDEEQNDLLAKIADYSKNFVQGLEGLEGKAADTMGIIGALGAAALLFFDPQTLMDVIIRVTDFIASIVEEVESVINMWDSDDIVGSLMNVFDGFSNLFEDFGLEMSLLIGFIVLRFNLISKTFRLIGSVFTTVGKVFSGVSKALKAIPGVAKGLFGVVGKLALPITIITGIIGGIVNSFDKFKEGDILGGFYAFVEGAFDSIISAPLNLIKDLTAWVMRKFGFDESADYLSSFDFSFQGIVDFISDSIGAIFDWVIGLIPGAGDAVKMVKEGVGGVVDFFTGGGDDEEEPQVTELTTDAELREMAKKKAADSWFTSEDEAFNDLVAQRFEAEDAYINQDQEEEEPGRYSGMNDYEKMMARMDRRKRKRAQKKSRQRRDGEAGGLEEDRINTSTPMERAVTPELQTENRDLGAPQEGDSRSLAIARNKYRVFGSEAGFAGEAEAARLKIIELEKQEAVSPVRDAVVENQMLREEEQATSTAAVVDNSSRQNSSSNVSSNTTNVYNTAYADDVNTSLALSP